VVKEDADRAVIRVSDTGHGIPTEYLSKVFDPFFTTKDVGKGTGLGLTVVHGIIHEHGGSIAVESEVDRGTTFTITLPLS
jgi:signal transduction histidine kinase